VDEDAFAQAAAAAAAAVVASGAGQGLGEGGRALAALLGRYDVSAHLSGHLHDLMGPHMFTRYRRDVPGSTASYLADLEVRRDSCVCGWGRGQSLCATVEWCRMGWGVWVCVCVGGGEVRAFMAGKHKPVFLRMMRVGCEVTVQMATIP
jgi:hypothetical protein